MLLGNASNVLLFHDVTSNEWTGTINKPNYFNYFHFIYLDILEDTDHDFREQKNEHFSLKIT